MMWIFWTLFASLSWAADERALAHEDVTDGKAITDVEISADGRWIGFTSGVGVHFLNQLTQEMYSHDACERAGLGVYEGDEATSWFVGCVDGTIYVYDVVDGEDIEWREEAFIVDTDEILLVVVGERDVLVIGDPGTGGNPQVHHVDPETLEVDSSSNWPVTLGYSGLIDAAADDDYLVICHSGTSVSKVDLASASAVVRDQTPGSGMSCGDVLMAPGSSVLISAEEEGVMRFATESNDLTMVIDDGDGLEVSTALTVPYEEDALIVADSGREEFVYFGYSSSTGNPGDEETAAVAWPDSAAEDEQVVEMVSHDGFSYAVTDQGGRWLLTDRPVVWLEAESEGTVGLGDEVGFTLVSDQDGDWEVLLGGTSEDGGEVLAEGSILGGFDAEYELTISDDFSEGDNLLVLEVTDDDGLTGRMGTYVSVDNPPSAVAFSADSIGFGNRQITVDFEGIEDEDLSFYTIYISLEEFDPEDYESGGPDYDGLDEIDGPFEISASPGESVIFTISPLQNGNTYYLAVRATDTNGLEGPMSDVVSARPRRTMGAAQLAGESGSFCGTPLLPSGFLALLGALACVRRRRSEVAALAVCALGVGTTGVAHANDDFTLEEDTSQASLEVRYGPLWVQDPVLQAVFGETGQQMLWLQYGPHFSKVVSFELSLGFYQELGFLLASSDAEGAAACAGGPGVTLEFLEENCETSSEHDMLTAFPVAADLGLRLDFFDEQFLVPTGSVGGEYWFWRENWYVNPDLGGTDSQSGGKFGWHWTAGLDFRLDRLEPGRASRLEAVSGIENTWFVTEYRVQKIDSGEGLSFSGSSLTMGIRFDI